MGEEAARQRQAAKDTLAQQREALRDQKNDTRIMEQEFARLARVFETQARRSGKKDVEISNPSDTLKAQANALNWRFLVKSDEIAIPNLCTCCIEKIVHFDYYI